ncbi:MAG: sugar-binding domain-containing protein, partial [candidate division KSB1 bacterium]|nr:sugar-binding domain-containing protein [candidate division KSB1 bacterium]
MKKKHEDIFARIAGQRLKTRDAELIVPAPEKVPDRELPLNTGSPDVDLIQRNRIDNDAKLSKELSRMRRVYQQYIRNLAPAQKECRIRKKLRDFKWRIEREEDRRDFSQVLDGDGDWESVTIPHYGPPLGRAVTYYRTTFRVTKKMLDAGSLWIHFNGVDYAADVHMNGTYLGSHEGFFSSFEFEFSQCARSGENVLTVNVTNDHIFMGSRTDSNEDRFEGEKMYAATGCGYDDPQVGWHHCPPGMGIYQDVFVEARS